MFSQFNDELVLKIFNFLILSMKLGSLKKKYMFELDSPTPNKENFMWELAWLLCSQYFWYLVIFTMQETKTTFITILKTLFSSPKENLK